MSKFSASLSYSNGTPVNTWFVTNFLDKTARHRGPHIPDIGPFNSTLLVLLNRIQLNDKTSVLYDQGSPTPSGDIYGFVEAEKYFVEIFQKDFERKHNFNDVFCLPLIYSVDDCKDLWNWVSDCSVNFVKGSMGNNAHSDTHIATAYLSALYAICLQLSKSATTNIRKNLAELIPKLSSSSSSKHGIFQTKPQIENNPGMLTGDAERHMLFDALKWISHTIRVLMDYSSDVRSIFQTLIMAYKTPNSLQSLIAASLLNEKVSDRMITKWIYLSYKRYISKSRIGAFILDFPFEIVAVMVIAPMIVQENTLVVNDDDNYDDDQSWNEKIKTIIDKLEKSFESISLKFQANELIGDYEFNHETLKVLNEITKLVSPDVIKTIHACVDNEQPLECCIIGPVPSFVAKAIPRINDRKINNDPYITNLSCEHDDLCKCYDDQKIKQQIRVIGADSSNWSAICLEPNITATIKIHSLGCSTQIGNTSGQGRVQNVRFSSTFNKDRADIMKTRPGVSTSGQVYNPETDKYSEHNEHDKIQTDGIWKICSDFDKMTIKCNGNIILESPSRLEDSDGIAHPLIAFKNCYLDITIE